MAFDVSRKELLLYGGLSCHGGFEGTQACSELHDTWVWDAHHWSQRHPLHSPEPSYLVGGGGAPGASNLMMVYDAGIHQVVLVDPVGGGWRWDGADWIQAWSPTSASPAVYVGQRTVPTYVNDFGDGIAVGFDESRNQLVVLTQHFHSTNCCPTPIGARSVLIRTYRTYVWDGKIWSTAANETLDETSPDGPDVNNVLAYDRGRRALVGVAATATWTWDGSVWQKTAGGYGSFPGRGYGGGALLYDPSLPGVVWMETSLKEVKNAYGPRVALQWNANGWKEIKSSNRPLVNYPATAFDDSTHSVVMVGGDVGCGC